MGEGGMTYKTPMADLDRAVGRRLAADAAARRARRNRVAAATTGCIGALALPFAEAWVLMLIMSAVHTGVSSAVPAVGYWTAVMLVVGLNFVTNYVQRMRKK